MPKISKQLRQVPLKTGPFVPILPRPQEETTIPQIQEMAPQIVAERIAQLITPVSIVTFPPNISLEDVLVVTARAVKSGSMAIIPRKMGLGHNVGFAHDVPQNVGVMEALGYDPTSEGWGGIENNMGTALAAYQGLPAGNAFIPSPTTQNMDTSSGRAIPRTFGKSPSRPTGRKIVAINLGANLPTEPFCAILDGNANYSCMTARGVARLVDTHPNVVIRQTTPSQRQGQAYPTPAGMIVNPQKFVVLTMKAFDPAIPPISVDMLIWDGEGPIADVEVYLGWQLFEKLHARKAQLEAGNVHKQTPDFDARHRRMRQNGNAGVLRDIPIILQSDMSPARTENPPGPAAASYGGDYFQPDMSRLHLPLSNVEGGQSIDHSDLKSTQSPTTSLFSEAPCSAMTVSSLDLTFAPGDTMAGLTKNPANDGFAGYDWAESDSHDDGPAYETIDPAMLSI